MKLARYEPVPMNIQKELQESREGGGGGGGQVLRVSGSVFPRRPFAERAERLLEGGEMCDAARRRGDAV